MISTEVYVICDTCHLRLRWPAGTAFSQQFKDWRVTAYSTTGGEHMCPECATKHWLADLREVVDHNGC